MILLIGCEQTGKEPLLSLPASHPPDQGRGKVKGGSFCILGREDPWLFHHIRLALEPSLKAVLVLMLKARSVSWMDSHSVTLRGFPLAVEKAIPSVKSRFSLARGSGPGDHDAACSPSTSISMPISKAIVTCLKLES